MRLCMHCKYFADMACVYGNENVTPDYVYGGWKVTGMVKIAQEVRRDEKQCGHDAKWWVAGSTVYR